MKADTVNMFKGRHAVFYSVAGASMVPGRIRDCPWITLCACSSEHHKIPRHFLDFCNTPTHVAFPYHAWHCITAITTIMLCGICQCIFYKKTFTVIK